MLRGLIGAAAAAIVVAAAAAAESPPQTVTGPDFSDVYSFGPAWSPDGKRLAVQRFVPRANGHAASQVVVMNADRSNARRLGNGSSPAWSPDGRRIVFVEAGPEYRRYLSIARADGSGSRRLFRVSAGGDDRPAWSPDGRLIAFQTGSDISIVRPDGTGLRKLIRGASDPDWSPDGSRLVFRMIDSQYIGHLEVADADGARRRRLQPSQRRSATQPRWSPDGRRIAFVSGASHSRTPSTS